MGNASRCQRCRGRFPAQDTGRPRRFCSGACKQAAYRRRLKRPVHFSTGNCERSTPPDLFADLAAEVGGFDLDACATAENAKCPRYFTRKEDGLRQLWTGRVWCNPPYGREIGLWLEKALESVHTGQAEVVVCLVPARPGSRWWHDFAARGEVRFLRGRVRFGGGENSAPFDSAVVVFRNGKPAPGALRNGQG